MPDTAVVRISKEARRVAKIRAAANELSLEAWLNRAILSWAATEEMPGLEAAVRLEARRQLEEMSLQQERFSAP